MKSPCTGHYLLPSKQIEKALKKEQLQSVPPPSVVLKEIFSKGDCEEKIDQASIRTLLPPDKVCILCFFCITRIYNSGYSITYSISIIIVDLSTLLFSIFLSIFICFPFICYGICQIQYIMTYSVSLFFFRSSSTHTTVSFSFILFIF